MKIWMALVLALFSANVRAEDASLPDQSGAGALRTSDGFPDDALAKNPFASTSTGLESNDNATGFSDLPTGSSSVSTGGSPSSIPEAGYTQGSTVTPAAPSSVPDFNTP